jgi:uncharacterized protein (TIGR02266 family)
MSDLDDNPLFDPRKKASVAPVEEDHDNRRSTPRVDFKVEVSGGAKHQFFTGFTENISSGGLFVATHDLLPLGTTLRVAFSVPGLDHQFELDCEVRWVRDHNEDFPDMIPGIGVRFMSLTPQDTQYLNEVLKRLDTLFYDDD